MSGGIKIPVGVAFDKGSEDRAIQDITDRINKLGETIARTNRQKFEPIGKTTLDDLRKLTTHFDSLKKISGELNRRLKTTGQGSAGFLDVDWSKLYPDPNVRNRQMQKAFDYVTGGGRFTAPPAPPAPGGNGGRPPAPPAPPAYQPPNYGRNIVAAGLTAAGPVGNVANNALSAGMAGGIGAGLAGLAGGLAALAIGKVISTVRQKVGAAQQEFIGYDTLKRQLGDVNVSFGVLKDSLREASRGLDMTFEEGQRLGVQFTKLAGISADQYRSLAEEVQHAGGFGRSFGLDPSQSNAFFAQMRQYRVTGNVEDSRRLGLLIGEGVAKAGAFSKVDEVLEAIAGYTAMQTRAGMNAANVGGYTGMLAGMIGSGIPGMDPSSAAMLLGRVNSSIAGGGGAGEAGQNFMYRALGSHLGLDPIQTAILREQGAFGTGAGTFGAGSTWEKFAAKYGLSTPGNASGSTATNLELIMRQFQQTYGKNPELMVNAMSNLFGVNNSQAMALATIDPKELGGLAARLQRNGVNINDVNATGISRIAQIEADGSLSEAEKDKRIKAAATENQEETEGSRTRATINGVERAVQDMAGKLVPIMNDVRSGIMYMAGEGGKRSPREIAEAVLRAESRDRTGQITGTLDPAIDAAEKRRELLKGKIAGLNSKREQASKWGNDAEAEELNRRIREAEREEVENQERISALKKEKADKLAEEKARLDSDLQKLGQSSMTDTDYRAYVAMNDSENARHGRSGGGGAIKISGAEQNSRVQEAMRFFMGKGWSEEQAAGIVSNMMAESGMRHDITGDGGAAYGLGQWHPDRQAMFKKVMGKDIRESTRQEQYEFYDWELRNTHKAAGDRLRAAKTKRESGGIVSRYMEIPADADGEAYRRGQFAETITPMPESVAGASRGSVNPPLVGRADVNVTLQYPNGQPAAAPVRVRTRMGVPVPAGADMG